MSFYSPWGFLFLITIPVLILLYILKQKYTDYLISSNYLWKFALVNTEARSPWQRLKKNILLFLQIIIFLLITFSLANTYLKTGKGEAKKLLVVVDSSFSMKAVEDGKSRFNKSKDSVYKLLSNIQPDTEVTFVTSSNDVNIELNKTTDKNKLLNRAKKIKCTNNKSDFDKLMLYINSNIKEEDMKVVVYTDTLFTDSKRIDFEVYNEKSDNAAILNLSNTVENNKLIVSSSIGNYSENINEIPLELYINDKFVDSKLVELKKNEEKSVYWKDINVDFKELNRIECRADIKDSIKEDNTAYSVVNNNKKSKVVLFTTGNLFLQQIFNVYEGIDFYNGDLKDINSISGNDLYIYDGILPEKLPTDGNILVFNPNNKKLISYSEEVKLPELKEYKHSLFNNAEGLFQLATSKKLTVPNWGEIILDSNKGIIGYAGENKNNRMIVFGFDLHNTNLPMKTTFPILITNVVEWLVPARIHNIDNIKAGDSVEFNIAPNTKEANVLTPANDNHKIMPPNPAKLFDNTDQLGIYKLKQDYEKGKYEHLFAVNSPAKDESNIKKATYMVEKDKNINTKKVVDYGYDLKQILILFVIIILLIEWWLYLSGI